MSILNNIPTPSFEFNAGLVDNRGALALVRQGQNITGQVAFPFVRNGIKNVPDKLGILRAVPANEPAVTFDGQGRNLGYLPESARTNLFQRTEEFDNSYWGKQTANVIVTGNTNLSPDNKPTADTLSGAIGTDRNQDVLRVNPTAQSSTTYTFSLYVKLISSSIASIFIRDATTGFTVQSQYSGTGWRRLQATLTTSASTNQVNVFVGNTDGDVAIWGAQLEAGSSSSSYIKNIDTTAGVTRPADILTYDDAQDLIGQSEGVIEVEVDSQNIVNIISGILAIETTTEVLALWKNPNANSIRFRIISTGSGNVNENVVLTQNLNKIIFVYSNSRTAGFVNGVKVFELSGVVFGNLFSTISVGCRDPLNTGRQLNDPIRSVRLWKTADWCTDEVAKLLTRI